MKNFFSLLILLSFLMLSTSVEVGLADESNVRRKKQAKHYFVAFHSNSDGNVIKDNGGTVKKHYNNMPVIVAELTDQAVESLKNNPKIDYIEEDGKVQATGQVIPWGVMDVKATDVQQMSVTGVGGKIGVLDTGIDYTHEDLYVHGGVSFVDGTTDYRDDNGHGTHVAGTIAGMNNTLGVLGVSPQANLYAIKVLDRSGNGNYSDVIEGIEWAIANDLNIINMSLGGTADSRTLKTAVDKAYQAGILVVASAGNNGYSKKGSITYPAAYDSVIAVGAVDHQNKRASFSSVGSQLELMAPGVNIESTIPGGYATDSGTSMAAPHVSAVAALVWQAKPGLTNIQVRNLLSTTAQPLGDKFSYGKGLVDALKAINQ